MANHLLIRLEGPLMAFGGETIDNPFRSALATLGVGIPKVDDFNGGKFGRMQ